MIDTRVLQDTFTQEKLDELFPRDRADQFFDALFGDVSEGAYDIELKFSSAAEDRIDFEFLLKQRPGKCLACNLTYGLPDVFARHPVINVKGLVEKIDALLDGEAVCKKWHIGRTREISSELHAVPLNIILETA